MTLKVTSLILLLVAHSSPELASSGDDVCPEAGSWANDTSGAVPDDVELTSPLVWMSSLIIINGLICLLAYYWRCFANNYLHWAALATWVLMNLQSMNRFLNSVTVVPSSMVEIQCGLPTLEGWLLD